MKSSRSLQVENICLGIYVVLIRCCLLWGTAMFVLVCTYVTKTDYVKENKVSRTWGHRGRDGNFWEFGPKTEGRRTLSSLRPGKFSLWSPGAEESLPSLRPWLTFRNMPVFEGENFFASGQIPKLGDYPFSNVCDASSQIPFVSWASVLNLQPVASYATSAVLYGTLAIKEL